MKKQSAVPKNSYTNARPQRISSRNEMKRKGGNKRKEKKESLPQEPSRNYPLRKWTVSLFRICLLISTAGMFFWGITFAVQKTYLFCMTNSFFNIEKIDISGNAQVKTSDIIKTCNIKAGMNCLAIDLQEMERKLVKNPWIEYAGIKRELPDTIKIEVKERKPIFCAKKNNTLYYINAKGELIAPVDSKNFISLPTLEIGLGGSTSLTQVATFIEYFRKSGFSLDMSQISWIKISAGGGFELFWESKKIRICIGLEKWKENIKRIIPVMSDIEKRKEIGKATKIYSADGQVLITKDE